MHYHLDHCRCCSSFQQKARKPLLQARSWRYRCRQGPDQGPKGSASGTDDTTLLTAAISQLGNRGAVVYGKFWKDCQLRKG